MNRSLLLLLLMALGIYSCSDHEKEIVPDISQIDIDFDIIRFEKDMQLMSVKELENKYPAFANTFFNHIIPVKREPNFEAVFDTIRSQYDFVKLIDTTEYIYKDFSKVENDLNKAFGYLKYYLPEVDIPDVYTIVSGFAYQRFILEDIDSSNIIGLGLDMFLGDQFPYGSIAPDNPAFSNYITRTFNQDHIAKKTIELLLEDYLPSTKKNQLLDQMIYNGKKLFLLDKIIPFVSDTIIMEYTEEQWDWVNENEIEMWAYFLKEKLFYESNSQKIGKYINPSPHSPGMPPNAPGRTANYLGWQIVKTYMKRFPEKPISEMIQETDAQEFLQKSRFKPKK